jgi:hypothetical protein
MIDKWHAEYGVFHKYRYVIIFCKLFGNHSDMLIGRSIAVLYFRARKITAEGAEERRVFNRLFPLRVPPRTLRLNSRLAHVVLRVKQYRYSEVT